MVKYRQEMRCKMSNNKRFATQCIHGYEKRYDSTGAISTPIYQSATFAHKGFGESTGFDYSRLQNPTREALELTVSKLEGGVDAIAFSTGMAAIATMMELFEPGDHMIVSDDLYGGSYRLFQHISVKNGMTFDFVNTSDATNIKQTLRPNTRAIFIETPTNPMMKVTDLAEVSMIAREHNCLLIVDNTFLTPYFQRPMEWGADIVVHSGTKFLGGHNDTLAGFLVIKDPTLSEKLRFIAKTMGACLAPFDCWLMIRGLKTLTIRMEQQQKNAMHIATWLEVQPFIKQVFYVGLDSHEGYEIMKRQSSGFGSMISFEVDSLERVKQILQKIKVIQYAESLGGVESLITYPMTQTHADVPDEIRRERGINETLLRMSVGLESIEDLIEDLSQAALN